MPPRSWAALALIPLPLLQGSPPAGPSAAGRTLEVPVHRAGSISDDTLRPIQELRARVRVPRGSRAVPADGNLLVFDRPRGGCFMASGVIVSVSRQSPGVSVRALRRIGRRFNLTRRGSGRVVISAPGQARVGARLRWLLGALRLNSDESSDIDAITFGIGFARLPAGVAPEQPRRNLNVSSYAYGFENRRGCPNALRSSLRQAARRGVELVRLRETGPEEREPPRAPPPTIDLRGGAFLGLGAASRFAEAGTAVAGAGDVNGDGREDVVVGVPRSPGADGRPTGAAYVVFGGGGNRTGRFTDLGPRGWRLGGTPRSGAGVDLDGVGDMNGDGLADLVVGAPGDGESNPRTTSAYVVFGRRSPAPVSLGEAGFGGFEIRDRGCAELGVSVAGAGDVNGDGRPDVLVAGPGDCGRDAAVRVVFGSSAAETVDAARLGRRGFSIVFPADDDVEVAGAGDFNGDGLADVLVGAEERRAAYLVYGRGSPGVVDVRRLGGAGRRISSSRCATVEDSVAGGRDVNGDGFADIVVGASSACGNDPLGRAAAYVVFGRPGSGNFPVRTLGGYGYRIDLPPSGDLGSEDGPPAVALARDLNGDGLAEVLVGYEDQDFAGRAAAGSAYVTFGRPSSAPVLPPLRLASLAAGGLRFGGSRRYDSLGSALDDAGDFDGDGDADLVMGAPTAPFGGVGNSGVVYLSVPAR